MARYEQDREDLMHEATALTQRVELALPGYDEPWVVGFRGGGEASIFVGADPVFQFNSKNELRRGFHNGKLLKAESGRLVQLERRRTESEVQLIRHELSESEATEYLNLAVAALQLLRQAIKEGQISVVAKVPVSFDAIDVLAKWLDSLPEHPIVANVPNVQAQSQR